MHGSRYALFILILAVKTDYSFGMQANIITTIAGNGQNGFARDGGPASEAMLSSPGSIAADSKGNIYIADWQNERIRKINPAGIITTVAGNGQQGFSGDGGPAINASLDLMNIDTAFSRNIDPNTGQPYFGSAGGIAVDDSGNLYIADTNNHRVRKVDLNGVITTVAGGGVGPWSLGIATSVSGTWIRLIGTSNGIPWQVANWRRTGFNGSVTETGAFGLGDVGDYTLSVDIDGKLSNTVSFNVSTCQTQ